MPFAQSENDKHNIALLVTGGTIDKQYNPLNGDLVFSESAMREMLKQGRATVSASVDTLMMKDSLQMTDEDRTQIAVYCADCAQDRIVITHGTDTMVETANAVAALKLDKTIVLVGAMVPFQFKESDALFNLGAAITAVQLLRKGVHLTMNGQVFDYDRVEKDRSRSVFHSPY